MLIVIHPVLSKQYIATSMGNIKKYAWIVWRPKVIGTKYYSVIVKKSLNHGI